MHVTKAGSKTKLYKAGRADVSQNQGEFRAYFDFPGCALPDHADHSYGPLATAVGPFTDPDTHVAMHPRRDEEIISWVPAGVMRHGDQDGNDLVTDADHLMVMNAGETFWHEEFIRADDPPLRMLQMFVRPYSLGLKPNIQHELINTPVEGKWQHLFGSGGSGVPLLIRNQVDLFDLRLDAGSSADLPEIEGRSAYFYVFDGTVGAAGTRFGKTESDLLVGDAGLALTADEDAIIVAFLVDPDASVARQGTIGR